jgi:hypothetical protein
MPAGLHPADGVNHFILDLGIHPDSIRSGSALIVADRRRDGPDSFKAIRDRAQARFLIDILSEDRPEDLQEAYVDAMAAGPQWPDRIGATLKRIPGVRALREGKRDPLGLWL